MRISCDLAVRKMVVRWGLLLELERGFGMVVGEDGRCVICIFGVFVVIVKCR